MEIHATLLTRPWAVEATRWNEKGRTPRPEAVPDVQSSETVTLIESTRTPLAMSNETVERVRDLSHQYRSEVRMRLSRHAAVVPGLARLLADLPRDRIAVLLERWDVGSPDGPGIAAV